MYLKRFKCNTRICGRTFTRRLHGGRGRVVGCCCLLHSHHTPTPLGGLLLAAALLAIVLALTAEQLGTGKPSANREGWGSNTPTSACDPSYTHLRLRVMDAFCSMSTERSMKSSSLVLTCEEQSAHLSTSESHAGSCDSHMAHCLAAEALGLIGQCPLEHVIHPRPLVLTCIGFWSICVRSGGGAVVGTTSHRRQQHLYP